MKNKDDKSDYFSLQNSKSNCHKKFKMHECYFDKMKDVDESMEYIFLPKIPKAHLLFFTLSAVYGQYVRNIVSSKEIF